MRVFIIALAVIYAIVMGFAQSFSLNNASEAVFSAEKTENALLQPLTRTNAEEGVEKAGYACTQPDAEGNAEACERP